jgi:hypothetical protein
MVNGKNKPGGIAWDLPWRPAAFLGTLHGAGLGQRLEGCWREILWPCRLFLPVSGSISGFCVISALDSRWRSSQSPPGRRFRRLTLNLFQVTIHTPRPEDPLEQTRRVSVCALSYPVAPRHGGLCRGLRRALLVCEPSLTADMPLAPSTTHSLEPSVVLFKYTELR